MDRYARHRAIEGFSQEDLQASRVAVIGAGAIGNEVVKNLCLLGVGTIDVYDFDTVELHNLTRSVLLREADVGRSKAASVAQRAGELDPAVKVNPVEGDVWETLRFADLGRYRCVIGALDNFEARLRVNQLCWIAGVDWINAGIDSRYVTVETFPFGSSPRESSADLPACYECGLPPSVYERIAERYSCGGLQRAAARQRIVPTTTITASFAGAQAVNPGAAASSEGPALAARFARRTRHHRRAHARGKLSLLQRSAACRTDRPAHHGHGIRHRPGGARHRRVIHTPQRPVDLGVRLRQLRQDGRDTCGGTEARRACLRRHHLLHAMPQRRDPGADQGRFRPGRVVRAVCAGCDRAGPVRPGWNDLPGPAVTPFNATRGETGMSDQKLTLRTADQSRRAEIDFDQSSTGSDIIQAAVDNWALPADMDYTLVNTTSGLVLSPSQSLDRQVKTGDVLEVQPVLVAG
jgi:molybdopterin/thiamine biosynthesis adenylyltransferase